VITEPTNAEKYLPARSGFFFVRTEDEAVGAVQAVRRDWETISREARSCAVECFDSVSNLKRILGIA
jgi:hypothetical protein